MLAACSPSADSSTTTASADTTTPPAESTTSQVPASTTSLLGTTTEPGSEGANCLMGTWRLDTESMIESLSATFAQEGFTGEVTANEGDYLVTINADGSLQVERDNWGFSVATPDGTFILTVDGTDEGTWSADDASITVTMSTSNVVSQTQVEVDGQLVTMPQSPVGVPDAIAESSTYMCNGDLLSVQSGDVEFMMNRA
jgi:RNase P/RNase MRP subunit p29